MTSPSESFKRQLFDNNSDKDKDTAHNSTGGHPSITHQTIPSLPFPALNSDPQMLDDSRNCRLIADELLLETGATFDFDYRNPVWSSNPMPIQSGLVNMVNYSMLATNKSDAFGSDDGCRAMTSSARLTHNFESNINLGPNCQPKQSLIGTNLIDMGACLGHHPAASGYDDIATKIASTRTLIPNTLMGDNSTSGFYGDVGNLAKPFYQNSPFISNNNNNNNNNNLHPPYDSQPIMSQHNRRGLSLFTDVQGFARLTGNSDSNSSFLGSDSIQAKSDVGHLKQHDCQPDDNYIVQQQQTTSHRNNAILRLTSEPSSSSSSSSSATFAPTSNHQTLSHISSQYKPKTSLLANNSGNKLSIVSNSNASLDSNGNIIVANKQLSLIDSFSGHFRGPNGEASIENNGDKIETDADADGNGNGNGNKMMTLDESDKGPRFSRKVFVGGLPPDIDEEEIRTSFKRFGSLVVDWPHKAESKSYFPPKGYAFLLFHEEKSVQSLIDSCIKEDDKLYICVSSPTIKDKLVQIRPWRLSDADYVMDSTLALDPRKTVFVGGVPRPLKASELAIIMNNLYGGVCYAGIDTDQELKYPKGAGRVAFSSHHSYIAAISARFVHLHHSEIEKRVEVKPYVLDDQYCDECRGSRYGLKFAPFFCANIHCLRYYCETCWSTVHSQTGREFHKPLVKEGSDRGRGAGRSWNS